jgi:DNA-binding XRE family transcriptional regulator
MATKKRFQSEALQYTYDTFIGDDAGQNASYEQELIDIEVAKRLYDLRTKAGLSQRELARKVGTTASAICRLEDADYEGHSLSMLRRIAAALDKRVEIRFVPIRKAVATRTRRIG